MRQIKTQRLFLILLAVIAMAGVVTGCGKKGPLYLPDKTQQPYAP
ncbi:MAG: lipoprotein [Gammaproteobacteria bacterium]|nr:lipoprotein [Gammaproteobacteria bacterium]